MVASNFNPDKDIPDLAGKVFFITGGTGGLGKETAITLSTHNPEHIYFSGRNAARAASVISEIQKTTPTAKLTFIECDLASLASVQKAANEFKLKSPRLDVLVLNAGIMAVPASVTADGYEIQFGTNHVGHALLAKLLLPTLLSTAESSPDADVRIVSLTSLGAGLAPSGGFIFKDLKTDQANIGFAGSWVRYGQSKLANIVYTEELARRYPNITAVAIHPGTVKTDLVSTLGLASRLLVYVTNINQMVAPEQGAYNQTWAATTKKENLVAGEFYEPVGKVGRKFKGSQDPKLAGELWDWTQKELENWN